MLSLPMRMNKWPKNKDEIEYDHMEIIKKMNPPVEIGKRGFFIVKEMMQYSKEELDAPEYF